MYRLRFIVSLLLPNNRERHIVWWGSVSPLMTSIKVKPRELIILTYLLYYVYMYTSTRRSHRQRKELPSLRHTEPLADCPSATEKILPTKRKTPPRTPEDRRVTTGMNNGTHDETRSEPERPDWLGKFGVLHRRHLFLHIRRPPLV